EEEGGDEDGRCLDEADADRGEELKVGVGNASPGEDLRAVEDHRVDPRRLLEEVDPHAGDQYVQHRRSRAEEQLPPHPGPLVPL
ncbi:hypothetical protein CRG98_049052, partial [Punica granatum]